MRRLATFLALVVFSTVVASVANAQPQSPEQFLGHQVGADFTLVKWPRIVEYFEHLAANSDRVNLRNLGETTEGKPFLFAEIADAATIANLQPHKDSQRTLADPRLVADEQEEQRLVRESKVPVFINCQLHSSETAASQMSMELAWRVATDESPVYQEIRERVILLLIPCANPDGQVMVADWYERSRGQSWEGRGMPWLYQKYAGHDNNRDWFMLNLQETQLTTEVLYTEWFPTIVWDVHQMGGSGPRLFVPPFHDPKNYNVHPVIDQTLLIIGGHMASDLAQRDMRGVVYGAMYDNWWAGGFRTTPYRHNMVGILTEMASVNLASPVFLRPEDLRGARRGLPEYEMQTNFPDPWPGGWWRLRDIVDYELVIAESLMTLAARYHDMFQQNYLHFGRESLETGANEPPFAWIVPAVQHDPRRAYEMLWRLHRTAVEVHRADAPFTADGVEYPAGTHIMYTAQPYRPHLMDMMERQQYPDRVLYPGGPAEAPYDMAGWTLPLQMGVQYAPAHSTFEAQATKLESIEIPSSQITGDGPQTAILPGRVDTYRLMNRLYRDGIEFQFMTNPMVSIASGDDSQLLPSGAVIVPTDALIDDRLNGLTLVGYRGTVSGEDKQFAAASKPRFGLYQPWTASMDEGWTRYVLDTHEYDYANIHNAEIRAGNLNTRYDAIVLPSIGTEEILQGHEPNTTAPEYVGGIGDEGVVALQDFVSAGGTLVCIDDSANLPIDRFNIPVKNVVRGLESSEFFCPGSVLRLSVTDASHPVAWGIPNWYSGYFARSQAFDVAALDTENESGRAPADRFPAKVISRYSDTVLLESGWIRGEDYIADKPAIVEVDYGDGHIVLIGFGVQRRAQPHGTFPILFNAIQRSTL